MNVLFSFIKKKIQPNQPGLYVLFYTEMWELFGRFGITALLVLYLTKTFHINDEQAFLVYSTFISLIYITPIIGGILCDRVLGNYHSVILGGTIMAIGNFLMVIPYKSLVFVGLSVVAVGNGFFLPSITPLVGYLYDKHDRGRDTGFTVYYLGKNIGALLAPVSCGFVGVHFGWNYAFILSGIGMVSGIIVFIMGSNHLKQYSKISASRRKYNLFNKKSIIFVYIGTIISIPIFLYILNENISGYLLLITCVIVFVSLITILKRCKTIERKHLLVILIMMFFSMIFPAFLNQGGTTLNLFIDRIVDRNMFGFNIPTSVFYSLDPMFMLIAGPALAILWTYLAKKRCEPSITTKFAIALILLGIGFVVFAFAAYKATIYGQASKLYVVLAYMIFPIAELCIVPIGLSLVTRLAPNGLNSIMIGIWMLSNAVSSYLTGHISKLGQIDFAIKKLSDMQIAAHIYLKSFVFSTICLSFAAIVLLLVSPRILRLIREESFRHK